MQLIIIHTTENTLLSIFKRSSLPYSAPNMESHDFFR